jgi:hypothetical protein
MLRRVIFLLLATALLLVAALPAFARSGSKNDRVQFGASISVHEDEEVGDLVCIGCSIHVQGTCGDVVAIGGGVFIEGTARGDVVAVGGGAKLTDTAHVNGDLVTIGGGLSREPGSTVGGEVVSQGGGYVMPLLIIVPLIPVILVVALIWWLITRSNRPPAPAQPTYTGR